MRRLGNRLTRHISWKEKIKHFLLKNKKEIGLTKLYVKKVVVYCVTVGTDALYMRVIINVFREIVSYSSPF